MSLKEEIDINSDGAKFVRADLHIHTFGENGSYDVKDTTMTPQNIVDLAIQENIQVISITDHNEINNVKPTIDYAVGKPILVLSGVELSTTEGHLLVYLPDFQSLRTFYGQLNITADKKMCNHTITQCLGFAQALGGFGVAAHIDLDSGFELYMKGYTPFKEAVLKHPSLLGLEISLAANENWFTDRDTSPERKGLINIRRTAINEDHTYDIAKLMSSDSHVLTALGKNAVGNKKITRLKMDELNFLSFKIALIDSTARVRIEDLIPPTVPHFVGLKFDGGFLDTQTVKLSKNLTCIIGGRGAGKSTVLESIRAASGNTCRASLVDNEVWPERISLLYEDESGRQQILVKDKQKDVINATDPANGITEIQIESFGQGETAETIQHCDKDPGVLINFFDGFVDFGNLKDEDDEICQELLDNQTSIERLTIDINTIPQIEKAKNNADEQVKALKAKNAKEVVELEEGLANEKSLRSELVTHLNTLIKGITKSLADKTVFDLVISFKEDKIIIGKEEFKDVKSIVEKFSKDIDNHSATITTDSTAVVNLINEKLNTWKEKESTSQNKIEEIRKEIEAKGGKLDLAFIRKVTKDASDYAMKLSELNLKKAELLKLTEERKGLLEKRKEIKQNVFRKRYEFVYRVNENLKATVVDFNIDIKIYQGLYSPSLSTIIKDSMGWRTSQVPKADIIVSSISYNDFLDSIKKKNSTLLQAIKSDGSFVFSKSDADQIISVLSSPSILSQIERCSFEDVSTITLTRKYTDKDGKDAYIKKDFSKLSLGQQQSILLSILLFSNRNCPLLIDQPEDNLDSEFIYKTLVKNLRRIKEHRQVIIVTHNANIAVLGDAELIVPLKSTSDKTHVIDRGSIDNSATKKVTCAILEGGEKAFIKRKEIYGV
ncbi:MAG: PHP domain-containing protein [Chryseotalea sp. WA131a]|nr:MAG: PHP domain-containing protein [Chryseotalea sp. WA131a]